jgi:hypothetical protein
MRNKEIMTNESKLLGYRAIPWPVVVDAIFLVFVVFDATVEFLAIVELRNVIVVLVVLIPIDEVVGGVVVPVDEIVAVESPLPVTIIVVVGVLAPVDEIVAVESPLPVTIIVVVVILLLLNAVVIVEFVSPTITELF